VSLRYTEQGMATGMAFSGALGERALTILDEFSAEQLAVIQRFVTAMADSPHDHVDGLDADQMMKRTVPGRMRLAFATSSQPARKPRRYSRKAN
jgi:hypothetical protein